MNKSDNKRMAVSYIEPGAYDYCLPFHATRRTENVWLPRATTWLI